MNGFFQATSARASFAQKPGEVLGRARVERVEIRLPDVGLGDEIARRLEHAGFGRHRLDVGHVLFS